MTDITPPRLFIGIRPCRIADTRGNGAPIQGGIFPNSGLRNWDVTGICGIPAGADAISVNFTVVSTAATPQGAFLLAWPTGSPPAPGTITAVMTFGPGVTILSNAAIVPLGPGESLTVNVSHSTHVIMDVNGYFSDVPDNASSGTLYLETNSQSPTAQFWNKSSSCIGLGYGCGVNAVTYGTGNGAAVAGHALYGGANSAGVFGGQSGQIFGGVFPGSGVRGESHGIGVLGVTDNLVLFSVGASGSVINSSGGAALAEAYLGYYNGNYYGVYSAGNAHVQGTFTAAINKAFVQPHPHDASKEIQYVSLEGPHSEVYFRGTAQISQGVTRIPIPEHFRFVADGSTYSTLVTPVGRMATVAVLSEGPGGITVEASRDVKIHYVVYAEREAVRNPDPIVENIHFRPNPHTDFLAHLPESFRQLMIRNGTLNADGTVNAETARRLGWQRALETPLRASPAP